jgi:hypothetical protein
MKTQKLAELIKSGYPYMKEEAGLAPWVLPEHGLNRIVDEAGDSGILNLAQPLGLSQGVERFLENAPDPAEVSPQAWQDAVRKWQHLPQLQPVIAAFLEVATPVMAQSARVKHVIDPAVICRNVAVLLFAPFVAQGGAILAEVAEILGMADSPAELVLGYGEAVGRRDVVTLDKIDRTIVKYGTWQEWAYGMQEQALKSGHTPKLVAVTPVPAAEIIGLLATMIEEGQHGSTGDSPKHPGEPVTAQ